MLELALSREELAWLEMTARDTGQSVQDVAASILREVMRDDMAEERKRSA